MNTKQIQIRLGVLPVLCLFLCILLSFTTIASAADQVTVTLNPNGGTVSQATLTVTPGSAYGTLPNPIRSGYVFTGWWTSESGGTQTTSDTTVSQSANHTLYAHWTQLVNVVFNPNGGSIAGQGKHNSTLDDSNIVTDTKAGSGGADISVVEGGYNIYGQSANINQDPNHGYYLLADDFTLPVKASVSEMEFYAYQTGSTTTSTITGIYLMIYDGDPSLAASKIIWGDNVTNRLKSTSWTGVYRVSPDFQGDTIRPVMNVVADTSGLSLDAGTYWFAFGLTGTLGSGPYVPPVCIPGDEISVGNSKQKLESGWQDSTDTLLQNSSQLRVIAVPYKVRYQVDGFTVLYGHPYGSLPVPTRSGYVFDGWWTSSTGGERVTSSTIASNSASHTLYAHWSSYAPAYEHRLIFYTNSGNDFAPALFTAGTKVDLSAYIPTREGFDFIGWYSDKELTVPVASVTLSNSVAVYAKWAEKAAAAFEDVPADAYYCDDVKWAVDKNVAEGTSSFAFDPDTVCTRAQMVTFLWRAMGCPEPTLTACPFTDVGSDAYYYKAVLWAAEKGIAKGTTAVTFSPNDAVTRGQAVSFLYRAAGMPKSGTSNPFSDVGPNDYWYDAVLWAAEKTITGGTSAATYSPADGCTRSQIITFLYRFLGR